MSSCRLRESLFRHLPRPLSLSVCRFVDRSVCLYVCLCSWTLDIMLHVRPLTVSVHSNKRGAQVGALTVQEGAVFLEQCLECGGCAVSHGCQVAMEWKGRGELAVGDAHCREVFPCSLPLRGMSRGAPGYRTIYCREKPPSSLCHILYSWVLVGQLLSFIWRFC